MSDTNDTSATRVQHESYTNGTSATQEKIVYFYNDASENIVSHPYINYMANERLQGEEQFHSKNYLPEMPPSHAKTMLKSGPQKPTLVIAKASYIKKLYTKL